MTGWHHSSQEPSFRRKGVFRALDLGQRGQGGAGGECNTFKTIVVRKIRSSFRLPSDPPHSPPQITPSSTTEMRTKLFPDETAEAMDDLEYHPHHVHTTGARSAGPGVGSGSGASPPAGVPPPSEIAKGAGERSLATPGTGPTKTNTRKGAAESGASGADGGGTVAGGGERGSGKSGGDGGTMMQRMNKTFRPDPLGAYTGDRSTLRFNPRRQEGSTMLRPRQQRTVFDASQISPMLQVGGRL